MVFSCGATPRAAVASKAGASTGMFSLRVIRGHEEWGCERVRNRFRGDAGLVRLPSGYWGQQQERTGGEVKRQHPGPARMRTGGNKSGQGGVRNRKKGKKKKGEGKLGKGFENLNYFIYMSRLRRASS